MAIHYFHCTDGIDLVLDRSGRETRDFGDVRPQALSVADELMREVPDYAEWERWSVCVYDETGQVEVVPFPPKNPVPKELRRRQAKSVREPATDRTRPRRSSH